MITEVQKNLSRSKECFSCGDPVYNRDHMLPKTLTGFGFVRRYLPNHPLKNAVGNSDNHFSVCEEEHRLWDKIKTSVYLGELGCGLRTCERFGSQEYQCQYEPFCRRDPIQVKPGEPAYWRYIHGVAYPAFDAGVENEPDPIRVCNTSHEDLIELVGLEDETEIMRKLDGEPAALMRYLAEQHPTPIYNVHFDPFVGAVTRTLQRYRDGVTMIGTKFSQGYRDKFFDSLRYVSEFERKIASLKRPPIVFDMAQNGLLMPKMLDQTLKSKEVILGSHQTVQEKELVLPVGYQRKAVA
jgi:hypothetical protein